MANRRNRTVLVLLFLLMAMQLSCGKAYPALSPAHPRLNQNMKDYYAAKEIAFAKGDHFEAKLLQCVKVKAFRKTYYHYWVVVAPRTEMPLTSFNMCFLPPPKLSRYFLFDHPFASNEMMKGSTPDLQAYIAMESVDRIWPIECRFTWTNYGDDMRQAAGITEESFDDWMRTLSIEVQFNGDKESLSLSANLPLSEITGTEDPLAKDNDFLQAILRQGICYAQRKPYRAGEN